MGWIRVLLVVCGSLGGALLPATVFAQGNPEIHNVGGTVNVRYRDINVVTQIRSGEVPDETIRRVAEKVVEQFKSQESPDAREIKRRLEEGLGQLKRLNESFKRLEQQSREHQAILDQLRQDLGKLGADAAMAHKQIEERITQVTDRIVRLEGLIEGLGKLIEQGRLESVPDPLERAQREESEIADEADEITEEVKYFMGRYRVYKEGVGVFRMELPLYDLSSTRAWYTGGGYSQEFFAWPPGSHRYSLAWHGYVLVRLGEAAGGFTVPLMDSPVYTPASFSQLGAVAEGGLELRMLRDVGPQLAIAIDGRVGWVSYASKDFNELNYRAPVLAIPVTGTLSWRATGAITISAQIGLVVDLVATELRYAYTGVGAQTRREDSFVGLHGTGGLHVDLAF